MMKIQSVLKWLPVVLLLWLPQLQAGSTAPIGGYSFGVYPLQSSPAAMGRTFCAYAGYRYSSYAAISGGDHPTIQVVCAENSTEITHWTWYFMWNLGCLDSHTLINELKLCVQNSPTVLEKNLNKKPCESDGNPINMTNGNKSEQETDYQDAASYPLKFERFYNSKDKYRLSPIGINWRHGYERSISLYSNSTLQTAYVYRYGGAIYFFSKTNGAWVPDGDVSGKLESLVNGAGQITGWKYTTEDDEVETYDADGLLLSEMNRAGLVHTLSYDADGKLISVADSFGKKLTFTYNDVTRRIVSMTEPGGGVHNYEYNANGTLKSVSFPAGEKRNYHYENPGFTYGLTGITDELGNRYATWAYDAQRRAISSQHAGGAEAVNLAFQTDGSTVATDAIGTSRVRRFSVVQGVSRLASSSQPGGAGCASSATSVTYDAQGNVATRTDFNGTTTAFEYDLARNLETRRIEAKGTAEQRTVSTEWHASYRLPARIAEPLKITTFSYDAQGNLTGRSEQATGDANGSQGFNAAPAGAPRTWSYAYTTYGRMVSATDPLGSTTLYTYYPDDDADQTRRGKLSAIANPLGQTTRINAYDINGRVLNTVDANGTATQMTYDTRGRLTSRDSGGEVTGYGYDLAGQLTRISNPDGSTLSYTYDAAHRLTDIADNLGNRIAYTLDPLGNRIGEDIYAPSGQLVKSITRAYDALGRLQTLTGVAAE